MYLKLFWNTMLQECLTQLNMRNKLSISMDGPNVNWKLIEMIQKEHAEQFGGSQIVMVGSCGLHTLYNAFKSGFTMWDMEKLLWALHYMFHNTPANLTKSTEFPLPFCGHRWIENLPVVERAIKLWPNIWKYVEAVTIMKLKDSHTSTHDMVAAVKKDPFILAKFHFFMLCPEHPHHFWLSIKHIFLWCHSSTRIGQIWSRLYWKGS